MHAKGLANLTVLEVGVLDEHLLGFLGGLALERLVRGAVDEVVAVVSVKQLPLRDLSCKKEKVEMHSKKAASCAESRLA